MPTSITQAIEDHLNARRNTHSPRYVRDSGNHIRRFARAAKVHNVEDILRVHVNTFLADHQGYTAHSARSCVREFLKWCKARYWEHTPQLQPLSPRPRVSLDLAHRRYGSRLARAQANAAKAAARMILPHQRAIYLLGYYYGLSLRKLVTMTAADLSAITHLHPELYLYLSRIATLGEGGGRVFGEWLGPSRGTAQDRWRDWVAPERLRFSDVMVAGATVLHAHGVRPKVGHDLSAMLVRALPLLDAENVKRLPGVWGP